MLIPPKIDNCLFNITCQVSYTQIKPNTSQTSSSSLFPILLVDGNAIFPVSQGRNFGGSSTYAAVFPSLPNLLVTFNTPSLECIQHPVVYH
jgi:hypothetical protein